MNIPTLGLFLRVLERSDGSELGAAPVPRVDVVKAALAVADPALAGASPWLAARNPQSLRAPQGESTQQAVQPAIEEVLAHEIVRTATAGWLPATAELPPAHSDGRTQDAAATPANRSLASAAQALLQEAAARAAPLSPRLSTLAVLVSELMQSTAGATSRQAIQATAPLTVTPSDVDTLAHALRESISQSGLFYESHLAEWALQTRALATLLQEPQSTWQAAAMFGTDESAALAQSGAAGGIEAAAGDATTAGNAATTGAPAANPMLASHLRMQLEALETGSIRWQGEPWPGQHAVIGIDPDDGAALAGTDDTAGSWRTTLSLQLPQLGRVEAHLAVCGDALTVVVSPGLASAAAPLQHAQGQLASALALRFTHSHVSIGDAATR